MGASAAGASGARAWADAARPANSSLMWAATLGWAPRINASRSASMRLTVGSSGWRASTPVSGAKSRHDHSTVHRSAGWMRAAPASSCSARYCGNIASVDTGLPASLRSMKSSSANEPRSIVLTAATVISLGRLPKRCSAASAARSSAPARPRPTSSSTPRLWCNWVRAWRNTAGSMVSRSPCCSCSLRYRRKALLANSSERRNSSCTHDSALRSSPTTTGPAGSLLTAMVAAC